MQTSNFRTSTQNSKESPSKSRGLFELPKIGKGSYEQPTLTTRFEWLTKSKDYQSISNTEILQQYKKLRQGLLQLNNQAAKIVSKISNKTIRKTKSPLPEQLSQLQERQKDNNIAIIARLKYELEQLQKRVSSIEVTGKFAIEDAIEEAKQKIRVMRHGNKELQMKSKQLGEKIHMGDAIFQQGRNLELECAIMNRKLGKLKHRWEQTSSGLKKVKKNLLEISDGAQKADEFIEQQQSISKVVQASRTLEERYQQHLNKIQAIKHNCQSIKHVKTQKYHFLLKQLEDLSEKLAAHERQINKTEEMKIHKQQEIQLLQKAVIESIQNKAVRIDEQLKGQTEKNAVFYTEIESLSDRKKTQVTQHRYQKKKEQNIKKPNYLRKSNNVEFKQNRTQPVRIKEQKHLNASVALNTLSTQLNKHETQNKQMSMLKNNAISLKKQSIKKNSIKKQEKEEQKISKTIDYELPKRNRLMFESIKNSTIQFKQNDKTIENNIQVPQHSPVQRNTIIKVEKEEEKEDIISEKGISQNNYAEMKQEIQFEIIDEIKNKDNKCEEQPKKEQIELSEDSFDFEEEIKHSRKGWEQARAKIDIQLGEIDQCLKRDSPKPKKNHFGEMFFEDKA